MSYVAGGQTPRRFTAVTASKRPAASSAASAIRIMMPSLLNAKSRLPRSTVVRTVASTCASSVTSQRTGRHGEPLRRGARDLLAPVRRPRRCCGAPELSVSAGNPVTQGGGKSRQLVPADHLSHHLCNAKPKGKCPLGVTDWLRDEAAPSVGVTERPAVSQAGPCCFFYFVDGGAELRSATRGR